MRKTILLLAASVLMPAMAIAQSASSTQMQSGVTGSVAKTGDGINGQDSRRAGVAAPGLEAQAGITPFGSNEYCPPGKIWGESYGVLYCLSTSERCESQFLTWLSLDGNSVCKAYAPATSAIKVAPLIRYRGVVVDVCPDGASRAECIETVQTTQSPPITLNSNAQVSAGVGTAAASCISGAWSISNTTCSGGGTTTQLPCAASQVSWSAGGMTCSANAPSGIAGQGVSLTDSAGPATGTAQAVCLGGVWGGLTGQTCSTPVPNCPATSKTWGSYCAANLPETANGGSFTATGSTGNYSGSATYSCVAGAWTGPSAASCSAKCYSQGGAWQWQQGGAICSGTLPSGYINPGTITVTDSSTSATDLATGVYSVTCKADGTWDQANQSISCTAKCPSDGALGQWTASNGQQCRGYLPAAPVSAGTYTINSLTSEMNVGTYTATCKSDGTWDAASVVTSCAAPCAPIVGGYWDVGSARCYADVPQTKAGSNVTVSDTLAPATGSLTGTCLASGVWSPTPASISCSVKCVSPGGSWPGGNCSYVLPSAGTNFTLNQSITVNDSTGPYVGSATAYCGADGNFQLSGTPTCTAQCSSPGGSIVFGNCTYSYPPAGTKYSQGQSAVATDSVGPWTGSTSFQCDSTGNWLWSGSASCNAPACSAGYVYWSSCNGYVGSAAHGGTTSASNGAANYTGSASFSCNAGSWQYSGGSCSYVPPPAGCSVPGGTYPVGNCNYVVPSTAFISHGGTYSASDNTSPWRGTWVASCSNGNLGTKSITCN